MGQRQSAPHDVSSWKVYMWLTARHPVLEHARTASKLSKLSINVECRAVTTVTPSGAGCSLRAPTRPMTDQDGGAGVYPAPQQAAPRPCFVTSDGPDIQVTGVGGNTGVGVGSTRAPEHHSTTAPQHLHAVPLSGLSGQVAGEKLGVPWMHAATAHARPRPISSAQAGCCAIFSLPPRQRPQACARSTLAEPMRAALHLGRSPGNACRRLCRRLSTPARVLGWLLARL